MESFEDRDAFIKQHIPFMIKTVSELTGRYVTLQHDEMSVAMLAFYEAMTKYDESKGAFLGFAKLVIRSRVLNHLTKENKYQNQSSLEQLSDEGIEFADVCQAPATQNEFADEIEALKSELSKFNLTFDALVKDSPKHKDTRYKAIDVSKQVSEQPPLISHLYEKYRLPIKKITVLVDVTEKFIKGNKSFITTVVIIFDKKYTAISNWIKGGKHVL